MIISHSCVKWILRIIIVVIVILTACRGRSLRFFLHFTIWWGPGILVIILVRFLVYGSRVWLLFRRCFLIKRSLHDKICTIIQAICFCTISFKSHRWFIDYLISCTLKGIAKFLWAFFLVFFRIWLLGFLLLIKCRVLLKNSFQRQLPGLKTLCVT